MAPDDGVDPEAIPPGPCPRSPAVTDAQDPPPLKPPGPRPKPPLPHECCDTACDPCVWTYHQRAVARWEQAVAQWEAALHGHRPEGPPEPPGGSQA
jgi:hypothetical protein